MVTGDHPITVQAILILDSDPEWEMAKSKKRRPRGKLMKCPEKGCKAKLKSRSSLKEHIKFVHGERRIPCPAPPCPQR